MNGRCFAFAIGLLLLGACSGDKMRIEKESTLAVVAPVKESYHPKVRFDVEREEVLNSYRELVKIIPLGQGTGQELRRLADLELESSVQKRLSIYPEVIAQGDQESFLAIMHYNQYLQHYPGRPDNDQVLYQLARAYALDSNTYGAAPVMERLVREYPASEFIDEIQFRRGEHLFVDGDFEHAAEAYGDIVRNHSRSIYFEKALYKLGWTNLKLLAYSEALENFMDLLDVHYKRRQVREFALDLDINKLDGELIDDVLRATSICFSYLPSQDPIGEFFSKRRQRGYTPLLYSRLGQAYRDKQRPTDAARIYIAFGTRYPLSPHAPELHDRAIEEIAAAGFISDLLAEKLRFIERFNKGTQFWAELGKRDRIKLQPVLTRHMFDVATHYHALARRSKKVSDFRLAADSYRDMLDAFPDDPKAHHINYLMAEALNDAGDKTQAIVEYNRSAYQYARHSNSVEAAYSALVARRELRNDSQHTAQAIETQEDDIIRDSIRFHDSFSEDSRASLVLLKAVEMLYDKARYDEALANASKRVNSDSADSDTRQHLRVISAHSLYRMERYADAEEAYGEAIENALPNEASVLRSLRENLALSIYRQGEEARKLGQHAIAAAHFLRLGEKVPESPSRVVAEYDAATEYVVLRDWGAAIGVLEEFRKRYPAQTKWKRGVAEKLALAFASLNQNERAADELLAVGETLQGDERAQTLIAAAELYDKSGAGGKAAAVYSDWVAEYPSRYPQVVEMSDRIASYYRAQGNHNKQRQWLKKVIEFDARPPGQRQDSTRILAAMASLELARDDFDTFTKVRLTAPLDKSLQRKKRLMQGTIKAYSDAARYRVAEVTTAATYHIGEVYRDFAQSLLRSERPDNLNQEELEEYNYLLEEQAFPFEEKAIDIHEKNIQRIASSGTWDDSVRGSLRALGDLLPFRYNKAEIVERFDDIVR
jgi:TolA-binding protein